MQIRWDPGTGKRNEVLVGESNREMELLAKQRRQL